MSNKEKLIYDLIFSEEINYHIYVSEYIKDMYLYDRFIDEIKSILIKSKVKIINERISVNSEFVLWEIKVKKQYVDKKQ